MLSKIWKKIGLIILIIACLWTIVYKLVNKISFDGLVKSTKTEMEQEEKANKTNTANTTNKINKK